MSAVTNMLQNDLSKWGLTKTIARHFFVPTLKIILLPMFLIIGGVMSGNMTDESGESETILAGFGLGELSVAVLSLTVLHAFNRNIKRNLEELYLKGEQKKMQIILNQQILLDTILFAFTVIPFFSIDKIYTLLNQDTQIATLAKSFMIPFLPGVYFFTISSLFFDYAEVNRQRSHSILALIVGLISLLTFNYLLVLVEGLQLTGVGIASSIGLLLQMLTIIALNWNCTIGLDKYVPILSQDTFNGLCKRFMSSIKSCILNIWSLWAFEFCLLMASYISEQAFAAQVVLLQIVILFLAMPYALGLVANHLITDSIDFYDAHEAKATSIIFQQYAIAIGILSVVTASMLRDKLLALYTNDDDLIVQCQSAWLPFMVFVFCWAVNLVISGALSSVSSSNQIINGYSQSAYWLVAAPMCLVGVLYLDETLEMLWVCLALFALLITPVTFALLNSIDFITLTSERKKQDEQMNNIEMVRAALDEITKT